MPSNQRCYVVGTLYIESAKKPSILDEVALEYHLRNVAITSKHDDEPAGFYFDPEANTYFFEDEFGRLTLRFSAGLRSSGRLDSLVSGSVAAVMGQESDDGFFTVDDFCFAGLPMQPQASFPEDETLVAITSDLRFNVHDNRSIALQTDLIKSVVCGDLTSLLPCGSVEALILCGNSLEEPQKIIDDTKKMKFGTTNYKLDVNHFKMFDSVIAEIVAHQKHAIIVPGPTDPANFTLPQQPLQKGLFAKSTSASHAKNSDLLHLVCNPGVFKLGSLLFHAYSGQNVADAAKYLNPQTKNPVLETVKALLYGRHIAPTAPDTLSCYPFFEDDPFVVGDGQCPHVVLVGNQPSFCSDFICGEHGQSILVLSVPSFRITNQMVFLNLKNLTCALLNIAPELLNL